MRLTMKQVYKQAKERPDLITFVIDPGWVKTGTWITDDMMSSMDLYTIQRWEEKVPSWSHTNPRLVC
jgi:hypothetical protein